MTRGREERRAAGSAEGHLRRKLRIFTKTCFLCKGKALLMESSA